ncbi:MAG: HK97 family phage prohead protease, partial [Candidatus Nitrosocaldaceae archaeon]
MKNFECVGNICFTKSDLDSTSNLDSTPRKRIVTGYASVQIRDLDNDIFIIEGLKNSMENYLKRGGLIFYDHKIPCGNLLSWQITEKDGAPALYIEAEIWNMGEKFDDFVWNEVQAGKIKGFSIRGFIDDYVTRFNAHEGVKERIINDVDLREISLVYQPANPEATLEQIIEKSKKGIRVAGHDISTAEFERRVKLIEKMVHDENNEDNEDNENEKTEINVDTEQYISYLAQLLNLLQKRNKKSKGKRENKIAQCMREKDREGWNLKDEKERKQALAICYNMMSKSKNEELADVSTIRTTMGEEFVMKKWIGYEKYLVVKVNSRLHALKDILEIFKIPENELNTIMDYVSKHRFMALSAHLKKYKIHGMINRIVPLANEIYQTKMILFDLRTWFIEEFSYWLKANDKENEINRLLSLAEHYAHSIDEEDAILTAFETISFPVKPAKKSKDDIKRMNVDVDVDVDVDVENELMDLMALEQMYTSSYKSDVMNFTHNMWRLKDMRDELVKAGKNIGLLHRANEVIDELMNAFVNAKEGYDKNIDQVLHKARTVITELMEALHIRVASLSFYEIKLIAEAVRKIRTVRASAVNLLMMNDVIDQKTIDTIKNAPFSTPILSQLFGHIDPDNQRMKDFMFSKSVKLDKEKIRLDNEICKALRLDQDAIEAIKDNMIYEITNVRQYRDLVQVFYNNMRTLEKARKQLNNEGKVLAVKPLDNIIPQLYHAFEHAKKGNFKEVKPVLQVYEDVKKTVYSIVGQDVYLPEFSMLANLAGCAKTILQVRVDTMNIIKDSLPDYDRYIDEDEFYKVPLNDSAIEAVFGYLLHPEYM